MKDRIRTNIETPYGQVTVFHPPHMTVGLANEWDGDTYQANVRLAVNDMAAVDSDEDKPYVLKVLIPSNWEPICSYSTLEEAAIVHDLLHNSCVIDRRKNTVCLRPPEPSTTTRGILNVISDLASSVKLDDNDVSKFFKSVFGPTAKPRDRPPVSAHIHVSFFNRVTNMTHDEAIDYLNKSDNAALLSDSGWYHIYDIGRFVRETNATIPRHSVIPAFADVEII